MNSKKSITPQEKRDRSPTTSTTTPHGHGDSDQEGSNNSITRAWRGRRLGYLELSGNIWTLAKL